MIIEKYLKKIDFTKPPSLVFLKRLTNQTGIIQHTKYAVPDRNLGYSVDDNARALIVAMLYHKLFKKDDVLELAVTYLSYIQHSKTKDNLFYNFLNYNNKLLNHAKTEDGFGRCFWALGYVVYSANRRDLVQGATHTLYEILPNIKKIASPRAIAYTTAGLCYLINQKTIDENIKSDINYLSEKLLNFYKKVSKGKWRWFENCLTYANAIFPYALALAYQATGNNKYLVVAKDSLDFLEKETTTKTGVPCPIGQNGWYIKGKEKAIFDQQPVEAACMVIANLAIFKITLEKKYYKNALKWFSWYHGNNIKKVEVYDSVTKGCFDGINEHGTNQNQGAESIVTYLLAYLTLADVKLKLKQKSPTF